MPDFFLPGPFAEGEMLGAILGSVPGAPVEAGVLPDHCLRANPTSARIGLVPAIGARTPGGFLSLGDAEAERVARVLSALAQGAERRVVAGPRGEAVAVVAQDDDWGAPCPDAPEQEWRAHLVEAAREAAGFSEANAGSAPSPLLSGISYRALARVRGAAETAPVVRRRGYGAADVEAIGVSRPYGKYFAIEDHRLRHRRFDGGMSVPLERTVFTSGDAVSVLPFDPVRQTVLLIEQFRAGLFARRDPHPWCLEAVAGRCDAGEPLEATAKREAQEEAGVALLRLERIAGFYPSPGMLSEHVTAFVGEADLRQAGGLHGLDREDEDIRVMVVPLAKALDLVTCGEVNNAVLLISLMWLGTHARRLTADWAPGG
jgi:ADP-ribose pyrophosphatase